VAAPEQSTTGEAVGRLRKDGILSVRGLALLPGAIVIFPEK